MGKRVVPFLATADVAWTDPAGRKWNITTEWAEIDGRAECVGVRIASFQPYTGSGEGLIEAADFRDVVAIKSTTLRAFPISVIEEARRRMARFPLDERASDPVRRARDAFRAPRPRSLTGADGKPMPTAEALGEVARVYSDSWRAGADPTKTVAETFTLTRSAAAKRVARARDAGLLPKTKQGRPRAGQTEKRRRKG